jgi:hypothetical protein
VEPLRERRRRRNLMKEESDTGKWRRRGSPMEENDCV